MSRVGLGTFVDPRLEGGKMNRATVEDLVEVIVIDGEEYLFYKALPINVAFIRGTTADPDGNITMEKEALQLETLALAIAARNSRGYVICQVERIAAEGSLDSRHVRLPGVLVDAVVVAEPQYHTQTYGTAAYNPALSGEVRIPVQTVPPLPLDDRKVIARRAAMELLPNSVVNLGIGLPDAVGRVASEERIFDLMTLTVDPGVMGGIPAGGEDFGAAINFQALIDHCSQFDFIDGGGLDCAFLGFAECDRLGNVNASRFADRIAGCGGFINITQNAKKAGVHGELHRGRRAVRGARRAVSAIVREGKTSKFVERVAQVTFNGPAAAERGQGCPVRHRALRVPADRRGDSRSARSLPASTSSGTSCGICPFRPLVEGVPPWTPRSSNRSRSVCGTACSTSTSTSASPTTPPPIRCS